MEYKTTILRTFIFGTLIGLVLSACTSMEDIDSEIYMEDLNKETFEMVDQMPEFPGGQKAMINFIRDNLKYPVFTIKANIQGRVVVRFVIDQTGDVVDITINEPETKINIEEGVNIDTIQNQEVRKTKIEAIRLLKEEAIRTVALMPKWTPGEQKGEHVSVYFNLPINFRLRKTNKTKLDPDYSKYLDETVKSIQATVNYPEAATKVKAKGQVSVIFTINKDGSLSNFEINDKNTHITFDDTSEQEMTPNRLIAIEALKEEAIQAIKTIQYIKPWIRNGKPINKKILISLKFNKKS